VRFFSQPHRIQHGGYLISVFAETNATFQIMAYTHEGTKNPLKEAHEGIALQRRNSLLSEWENGELRVRVRVIDFIDGVPVRDLHEDDV
jgi:hypothetical protein